MAGAQLGMSELRLRLGHVGVEVEVARLGLSPCRWAWSVWSVWDVRVGLRVRG